MLFNPNERRTESLVWCVRGMCHTLQFWSVRTYNKKERPRACENEMNIS